MIKRLKIKFVCINMSIVVVMLTAIFVMMFVSTSQNLERESVDFLRDVAANPMRTSRPGEGESGIYLPYFFLDISNTGDIITINSGYYDLRDEARLRELISIPISSPERTGIIEGYHLRYYRLSTPTSQRIVFGDISNELNTISHLVQHFLLIGGLSLLVFLLISIALAHWAIRPVEEAWQQQRRFVADASHELKTPLTVILANTDMIRDSGYDPAQLPERMDNIAAESDQMRQLVESLLELARADNGSASQVFEQVDFNHVVESQLLTFEPLFYENGFKLESDIQPGIRLYGSTRSLGQVAEILLDNASKYTMPKGHIAVSLKQLDHRHCLLSVGSEGEAIPPDELKKIFHRFYRRDASRAANGSYGLGLSIAENIVKKHRGRIWAESSCGVNTFFVRLPLNGKRSFLSSAVHK